jgi:hypothetical protein
MADAATIVNRVIDTKYLATHEYGPKNARSALEELDDDLRLQVFPTIST